MDAWTSHNGGRVGVRVGEGVSVSCVSVSHVSVPNGGEVVPHDRETPALQDWCSLGWVSRQTDRETDREQPALKMI